MINDCQKCDDFDRETKELVGKFLSQDEARHIVLLLAGAIYGNRMNLSEIDLPQKTRFQIMAVVSFQEQLLGKTFISLNPAYQDGVKKDVEQYGIPLNIKHGPCPHKP